LLVSSDRRNGRPWLKSKVSIFFSSIGCMMFRFMTQTRRNTLLSWPVAAMLGLWTVSAAVLQVP
jgi:hypothetical protein